RAAVLPGVRPDLARGRDRSVPAQPGGHRRPRAREVADHRPALQPAGVRGGVPLCRRGPHGKTRFIARSYLVSSKSGRRPERSEGSFATGAPRPPLRMTGQLDVLEMREEGGGPFGPPPSSPNSYDNHEMGLSS